MTGRRHVIASLSHQQIASVLNLPDDVHVVGIQGDWQRMAVSILLESARFEEVPDATEPPFVFTTATMRVAEQGDHIFEYSPILPEETP